MCVDETCGPPQPLRPASQAAGSWPPINHCAGPPGAVLRPLQVLNAMQQALEEVKLERDAARKQVRSQRCLD